jgi:iron complex outermembrane receptor protein
MRTMRTTLAALSLLVMSSFARADEFSDLLELPIEDLSNIRVGVLNIAGEKLLKSSAAISVLTSEDIRRSRATSLPEVLRLIPGVSVGRLFGGVYSVEIRSDQGRFADKILILLDGLPIYTPEFGGVPWEVFDMYLPDIERVEVTRGPGASQLGMNAINGIISVITKKASQRTKGGGYVSLGNVNRTGLGGSVETGLGSRAVRMSLNHHTIRDPRLSTTPLGEDQQDQGSLAVRVDSEESGVHWTTQLRANYSSLDNVLVRPDLLAPPVNPVDFGFPQSAASLQLGRIVRETNNQYFFGFQQSIQKMNADIPEWRLMYGLSRQSFQDLLSGTVTVAMLDVDGFARKEVGKHTLVYGFRGKGLADHWYNDSPNLAITNQRTAKGWASGFFQDTLSILDDSLELTAGSKIQFNDYGGFQYEPSVRVSSALSDRVSVWTAWSRAVRNPNRIDVGLTSRLQVVAPSPQISPVPVDIQLVTNRPNAEVLHAFEAGVRGDGMIVGRKIAWDSNLFYNSYSDLVGLRYNGLPDRPDLRLQPTPHFLGTVTGENLAKLTTCGNESQVTVHIAHNIKVTGWYSGLYRVGSGVPELDPTLALPKHQAFLRLTTNPWNMTEVDVMLRTTTGAPNGVTVVDNRALDLRLAYAPSHTISYEIVGTDLLHHRHVEARTPSDGYLRPVAAIQRGVLGRISYKW